MLLRLRKNRYDALEKSIGYAFRRPALLEAALTHRSYRFETRDVAADNQRLEFLGDAVLGLVVAAELYRAHSDEDEGTLTELRSRLTSGKALGETAERAGLGPFIMLGKGEEQAGGRQRHSLLADAMEAVIGAAFLDGGLKAAERIVRTLFVLSPAIAAKEDWQGNPKGKLQELAQRRYGRGPDYRRIAEDGPAHRKTFSVEVLVDGVVMGAGTGMSRREAEVRAAAEAVRRMMAAPVTTRHEGSKGTG